MKCLSQSKHKHDVGHYCPTKGLFTNYVGTFWGLLHPLVVMSAHHHLLAYPLVLKIDNIICGQT